MKAWALGYGVAMALLFFDSTAPAGAVGMDVDHYKLLMSENDGLCRPLTTLYTDFMQHPGALLERDENYPDIWVGERWETTRAAKFAGLFKETLTGVRRRSVQAEIVYNENLLGDGVKRPFFLGHVEYGPSYEPLQALIVLTDEGAAEMLEPPTTRNFAENELNTATVAAFASFALSPVPFIAADAQTLSLTTREKNSPLTAGKWKAEFNAPYKGTKGYETYVPSLDANTIITPISHGGRVYFIAHQLFHFLPQKGDWARRKYRHDDLVLVFSIDPTSGGRMKLNELCYIYRYGPVHG